VYENVRQNARFAASSSEPSEPSKTLCSTDLKFWQIPNHLGIWLISNHCSIQNHLIMIFEQKFVCYEQRLRSVGSCRILWSNLLPLCIVACIVACILKCILARVASSSSNKFEWAERDPSLDARVKQDTLLNTSSRAPSSRAVAPLARRSARSAHCQLCSTLVNKFFSLLSFTYFSIINLISKTHL